MSAPLRKAALVLSGLGAEDRGWLLARFEPGQREALSGLVRELEAMDLALDGETVKHLMQAPPEQEAAETDLARASARAVFDVLASQPDRIVAIVLAARSWSWREAFVQRLGAERRLRVQRERPARGELREQAVAALLAAVEARLDEDAAAEPVQDAPPRRPWARPAEWLKGLGAWRR